MQHLHVQQLASGVLQVYLGMPPGRSGAESKWKAVQLPHPPVIPRIATQVVITYAQQHARSSALALGGLDRCVFECKPESKLPEDAVA